MRIGFIGLGHMGGGMAPNVVKAGHEVCAFDLSEQALAHAVEGGCVGASSTESDRYEELLVNPTVLTLIERRGRIDCGGLAYVIIRYGNFFQILHALPGGHLSVAIEPQGEPLRLVEALRRQRDELEVFRAVKRVFDPKGLLNPGKAIPTLSRCAEFGRMHVRGGKLPHADLPRF